MKAKLKIWIILSNVIWAVLFAASLLPVALSVMLFDAPGSENSFLTQLAFIAVLLFPVSALTSIIGSWITYKKEKFRRSIFFMLLPLLSIIFIVLTFSLMDILCGGQLSC